MGGLDLAKVVSCEEAYEAPAPEGAPAPDLHVVAYDYGIKRSMLGYLAQCGFRVTVVPAQTSAQKVLKLAPDGVFLSNGPGDPAAVTYGVKAIERLLGKVPVFGICLGHQLLAQALGMKTFKLKFGHRGANHPLNDGTVEGVAAPERYAFSVQYHPESTPGPHDSLYLFDRFRDEIDRFKRGGEA
jgi:carbamoyl-phosphate synthase small subunit